MYAIVENGSKQYKAEVGSVIRFEKLSANVGDKVEFDVLMISEKGKIKVLDAAKKYKVVGEVIEQGKDKKIVVFKYKAKKNERKKQGHRQPFTSVKVLEITLKDAVKSSNVSDKAPEKETAKETVKETVKKAPAKKAPAKKPVKEGGKA